MNPTQALLDFANRDHALPPAARDSAIRLLSDTLVVGAAGSSSPAAEKVHRAAKNWGSEPEARLLAWPDRASAGAAAYVNAFQIHCLEWDAVHEPAVVHAMAVVTAALLAAIDRRGGCPEEEALVALAVGVDIAAGLGIAANSPLRFFRPATAGLIGAALAAARIDRVEPLADVLGLACSQCAGTMQAHVEGSVALPLQIANAARAAITAVDLVKSGLSGPHDALEGSYGYFPLFDTGDLGKYTSHLGRSWRITEVSTKPYPSGRASHGMLSALAEMLDDGDINAASIDSIECFLPPLARRLVGRPLERNMEPPYARLCLPFLAALMLTDGRIDPRRFTPDSFRDGRLRELASRVHVLDEPNSDPNALSPQRVRVTRVDDTPLERVVPRTLGHPARPMTAQQTESKRALARELALPSVDSALFKDPLRYFAGSGSGQIEQL